MLDFGHYALFLAMKKLFEDRLGFLELREVGVALEFSIWCTHISFLNFLNSN